MIINDLEEGKITSDSSASTDFTMTSAILSGLTQSNISMQTKHNCPSGNCTWDSFQPLAVCSICTDITDRLRTVHVSFDTGCPDVQNLTVYRLPNGLRLTNPRREFPPDIWMTGFGTDNQSQSVSFESKDTLIWSMTLIRVLDPKAKWPSSVSATECGLWYCVRNYSSVVKDGNLIERSSPVPSTKSRNSWQLSTDNDPSKISRGTNGVTDTLSYGEKSAFRLTDLQLGNGFNVSQNAVYGINNFMNTTFTRSSDPNNDMNAVEWTLSDCTFDFGNTAVNAAVGQDSFLENYTIYTSQAMPFLFNSPDLNATFATLAKSIMNSIRENSDDYLVRTGKVGILHVMYQINWKFLILPIILVFANALFLMIVVYYTRKLNLAVLCSDALPVISFGGNIGPVFYKMKLRSQMEKAAKLQQVQFAPTPTEDSSSDDVEAASLSHEDDGHETVLLEERLENQDRAGRSDEERSIVSAISEFTEATDGRLYD